MMSRGEVITVTINKHGCCDDDGMNLKDISRMNQEPKQCWDIVSWRPVEYRRQRSRKPAPSWISPIPFWFSNGRGGKPNEQSIYTKRKVLPLVLAVLIIVILAGVKLDPAANQRGNWILWGSDNGRTVDRFSANRRRLPKEPDGKGNWKGSRKGYAGSSCLWQQLESPSSSTQIMESSVDHSLTSVDGLWRQRGTACPVEMRHSRPEPTNRQERLLTNYIDRSMQWDYRWI